MDTSVIILLIVIGLILTTWLVYNFYWLAQPQVYLVTGGSSSTFDLKTVSSITDVVGGDIATMDQLVESFTAGASTCAFGWVKCTCSGTGSTSYCQNTACQNPANPGYGAFLPLNVDGITGQVVNCGPNHKISSNNTQGTANYWIYGKKPVSSTFTDKNNVSWTVQPWIGNSSFKTDGKEIFNRFQIFGIPKII
jgi:hypothetical protein